MILNGETSKSFKVTRGVRQGDPLSCLLFNLAIAIESLAQMLRESNLKGIMLDGEVECLIATLFADDTTVYLAEDDTFQDLTAILKDWCEASGARFNIPKTVIVPIGTPEHRSNLLTTCQQHPDTQKIPEEIKITRDGEATCLLGAFISNEIDNTSMWTPMIEAVANDLKRWNKEKPSMEGQRLVIGIVIGGRTQYRTRVQGMPKQVKDLLAKMCREFLWKGNSKPTISLNMLRLPFNQGGRKVLDIRACNEAIKLMKAQRYLKLDDECPKWAQVADKIISERITKKPRGESMPKMNPFLQETTVDTRNNEGCLPASLQHMIRAAKKYRTSFETLILDPPLREDMPVWLHKGTRKEGQYQRK